MDRECFTPALPIRASLLLTGSPGPIAMVSTICGSGGFCVMAPPLDTEKSEPQLSHKDWQWGREIPKKEKEATINRKG